MSHDPITKENVGKLDTIEELNTLVDNNRETLFYIEIKEPATVDEINYILSLFEDNKSNVIIQVSTIETFKIVNSKGFKILVLQFADYSVKQYIDFCNKYNCYIGFGYYGLTEDELHYINDNFNRDIYWTIDDKEDYKNLIKYKPYGIMTNKNYELIKTNKKAL